MCCLRSPKTHPKCRAFGVKEPQQLRNRVWNLPGNHCYYAGGKPFFDTAARFGSHKVFFFVLFCCFFRVVLLFFFVFFSLFFCGDKAASTRPLVFGIHKVFSKCVFALFFLVVFVLWFSSLCVLLLSSLWVFGSCTFRYAFVCCSFGCVCVLSVSFADWSNSHS
jgi:hypothetical protein